MDGLESLFGGDNDACGYKSVHKQPRPPLPPPLRQQLPCGLESSGATCYLNSLLQVLFHITPFRHSLYALENISNSTQRKVILVNALREVFSLMNCISKVSIFPESLFNAFSWTEESLRVQHDAQEFARLLFDALSPSPDLPPNYQQILTSIQSLFHGQFRIEISCKNCGRKSSRNEDFLDVLLPIANKSSLTQLLLNHFSEEFLDGYRCDMCGQTNSSHKSMNFDQLPSVLNIVLNRFTYDWTVDQRVKNSSEVLLLDELTVLDKQYKLFGVVTHAGDGYSGHYMSRVYLPNDEYFNFDDAKVSKISSSDEKFKFPPNHTPYLLFFVELSLWETLTLPQAYDQLPSDLESNLIEINRDLEAQRNEFNKCLEITVFSDQDNIGRKIFPKVTEPLSVVPLYSELTLGSKRLFLIAEPELDKEVVFSLINDYTDLISLTFESLDFLETLFFVIAPPNFWSTEGEEEVQVVEDMEPSQPLNDKTKFNFLKHQVLKFRKLPCNQIIQLIRQEFSISDSLPLRIRCSDNWGKASQFVGLDELLSPYDSIYWVQKAEILNNSFEFHTSFVTSINVKSFFDVCSRNCSPAGQIEKSKKFQVTNYSDSFKFPFDLVVSGPFTCNPVVAVEVEDGMLVREFCQNILPLTGLNPDAEVFLLIRNKDNDLISSCSAKSSLFLKFSKITSGCHVSFISVNSLSPPPSVNIPLTPFIVTPMGENIWDKAVFFFVCQHTMLSDIVDKICTLFDQSFENLKIVVQSRKKTSWTNVVLTNNRVYPFKAGQLVLFGDESDPRFTDFVNLKKNTRRSSEVKRSRRRAPSPEVGLDLGMF
ncbi:hypothetical protein GEMRC1_004540 [Eukaryota sp. GEM-RC1]